MIFKYYVFLDKTMDSSNVKAILSKFTNANMLFVFNETELYYLLKEKGQYKMQIKYLTGSDIVATTCFYNKLDDVLDSVEPLGFKLKHSLEHNISYELINLI